jgi:hypothetical protein
MNFAIAAACAVAALTADLRQDPYFQITVLDEATGRGVPLIELRTVNDLRFYTDSAGVVAFQEPGLMDQSVFFHVGGHGYELSPDGFGFRGRRLKTVPGGSEEIKVRRVNIAERLYRITGAGVYAESIRVGQKPPIREPLLNAQVIGSDSVQAAVIEERIHWFWGDTIRPSYPLGNFHAPGATSKLPANGGLDPNVGVELEYFVGDDGFAKSTCQMPGEGPTWIDGMAVVNDGGTPRLFAHYLKIKPPLTVYQHGLAEFNQAKQEFEQRLVFPKDAAVLPSGHSFVHSVEGSTYVYFAKPFPIVRVPATASAVLDPAQYEAFTCLMPGSSADDPLIDRDETGKPRYRWKPNSPVLTPEVQKKLIAAGKMKSHEGLYQPRDIESNKPIAIHHGSINWNAHRRRWILIASELRGTSLLGEVWYAEADSPLGPWAFARKIVTHEKQSFYNPRQHPFFDQQEGRIVFFEGTYTHSFSGNEERTPRYEYNQIMYRLDLNDARLNVPAAVYRHVTESGERLVMREPPRTDSTYQHVAFWACDRLFEKSVAVFAKNTERGTVLSLASDPGAPSEPLFYARPPDAESHPRACVPLFELTDAGGNRRYVIGEQTLAGYQRADRPICYVWSVAGR